MTGTGRTPAGVAPPLTRDETGDVPPPGIAEPEPSVRVLVTRLFDDGRTLVRQEIDLARTETIEVVRDYSRVGATVAGGVFVALAGVTVFLAFVVLALGELLGGRYWLSALGIGLLFMIIGGVLARRGRARLTASELVPARTIDSLRDTAAWASMQAGRIGSDESESSGGR